MSRKVSVPGMQTSAVVPKTGRMAALEVQKIPSPLRDVAGEVVEKLELSPKPKRKRNRRSTRGGGRRVK